jgi:hypothetical protein
MSERARELAERFEQTAEAFADEMARLSPAQWGTFCPDEERTVAALARHVGVAYGFEIGAFAAMAEGREWNPLQREALNQANADDGKAWAACDQAETVEMLRREAAETAAVVRGFTDEQLARSGLYLEGLGERTVAEWLESILLGHIAGHLTSIRAAVAGRPGS